MGWGCPDAADGGPALTQLWVAACSAGCVVLHVVVVGENSPDIFRMLIKDKLRHNLHLPEEQSLRLRPPHIYLATKIH